ncbi:hypothetical protein K435DRAFT_681018 [Dendrothele bispora CBS 962.96]|uniref:Prolyl 4-hydroxylase alpha subunit Fe(2+) 2OG dioxygenase domain-containing protein n=1 Tax=Dendrothele bispora (strain CBS 962.96) TaxID=1314807 RepID=A0A4S8LFT1_DENBC|nr:hypothetical protein K435DRAFT_681018 [Dendrothele bispora CBS 962.96]
MPEHLKANLLESLNLALRGYSKEDQLTEKDTSDNPTFTALHFSYYSKYGTEGTFVPRDIHPHKLKNKNTSRTNHSQFLTRESADMRDHPEQYRQICDALEPILRWVVEKRLKRHPDLFSEIEGEVDIYPLNDTNPVHPFSSFIINLNVKTQAHRDGGDKNGCIVLVLGDHIGGGVCLHEAKLVVEASHGDCLTFRSRDLTHFNLSYSGIRASIVIHSDRAGAAYQKNGFGWDSNEFVK